MEKGFADAQALEADLARLCVDLAELIAQPAAARDAAEIRQGWQEIENLRWRANSLSRTLASIDRKAGRKERLGNALIDGGTKRYVQQFSNRIKMWDAVHKMVARHANPERRPLLREIPDSQDVGLLEVIYRALHRLAGSGGQSEEAEAHGCFSDIPMPVYRYETLMLAAYRILLAQGRTGTARFIDVGCGGGSKVFLASRYFAECHGLDYDRDYIAAAERTLRTVRAESCFAFQADALVFDGYGDYDVIYFYRPMIDDRMLARLEDRVLSTARPGTVILAPYDVMLNPRSDFDCARIERCIFIAGITQDEADAIRYEAEHTDDRFVTRSGDFARDPGFWSALLDASRFDIGVGDTVPGLRRGIREPA
ncbi:hypothetical protein OB2597_13533 [Pseudooceanicola batsensis HTCC2597]|uniref:Methyltransferase domain-containing protein n=1 Tax=Pseudooceanicola batsensis (strain ATCC BAA-863 / DSM 15984 / KCTC 12145 / HTCC2597) TaxID=252305 RepID=A3TYD5_PSEBH|nr:class I SAM-dependent methyltransferase [Pseudooceanicola batsensis]EAQ03169.1 hypothetical protein OB2597_13533 [Pseudooceanicola batsensis HTCC2597]